jgi:hypothetical protein
MEGIKEGVRVCLTKEQKTVRNKMGDWEGRVIDGPVPNKHWVRICWPNCRTCGHDRVWTEHRSNLIFESSKT